MAPRSSRHHSRYDDPYTFDDPYIHSPPTSHGEPGYEYIGTDEPLSRSGSPTRRARSPDPDRARRHTRTTSPPRHLRRDRAYTQPPHPSRRSPSPRPKDGNRDRPRDSENQPKGAKGKHFYNDFANQNPKLQQYGKQGMTWLSEAAAAYAAAQAGKDAKKSQSVDRGGPYDRDRQHHRRYASSPSPSPSPPRRRHSARHGDRDRDRDRDRARDHDHGQEHNRRRRYSTSPPPLSRDPDSYLASRHSSVRDRDRDRDRDLDRGPRSPIVAVIGDITANIPPLHLHHAAPAPAIAIAPRHQLTLPRNDGSWRPRRALQAGGLTAFRLRKEPGSWKSDKAAKIATAALGAAAMDAFMDKDPRDSKSGMKGMAESAISGLIASQIMGKGAKKKGRAR
ncbi:hypothetical protein E0Z10_g8346 [Xylaria hypoxylon]|uniref:Uncharacterized protein n=1 Tax=Xylaria hypoxylon TaxID=37992 RepID=A0A4Z0YN52_9PEZI|nr:hypothetical protein E0Z10_g8346 [Xylaria hypoxylon]